MGANRYGTLWLAVAVVAFLAVVAYVVGAVAAGSDVLNARDDAALLALGAVALFSLAGWWWDRSRLSAAREEAEEERGRLATEAQKREGELAEVRGELERVRRDRDGLRQERVRLRSTLEAREGELERERYLRARSQEARQAERDWNRELQVYLPGFMHYKN